eukprot:366568-Chlamydomonas_euryale.AAC.22
MDIAHAATQGLHNIRRSAAASASLRGEPNLLDALTSKGARRPSKQAAASRQACQSTARSAAAMRISGHRSVKCSQATWFHPLSLMLQRRLFRTQLLPHLLPPNHKHCEESTIYQAKTWVDSTPRMHS